MVSNGWQAAASPSQTNSKGYIPLLYSLCQYPTFYTGLTLKNERRTGGCIARERNSERIKDGGKLGVDLNVLNIEKKNRI